MASTPIPQSSKLKWTWPPLIRKENILQVNIEMRGKGEVPSMKLILKWYQLHLDYLSLTCNISSFHCLGKATVLSCNSRMRIGWWLSTYRVNICMLNCLGQATVLSCNSCKRIGWWLSTYLVNIWMLNCLGQATVLSCNSCVRSVTTKPFANPMIEWVTECASENLSESSSCSQPLLKNELPRKDSERGREGASEGVSERASDGWGNRAWNVLSLSATNTSRATAPSFCCINWEPGYILLAGMYNRHNRPQPDVQPAGRRVQPVQPDVFLIKKNNSFFLLGISPVVPVVHACQPVVRLVLDGCAGCTCLPAKCT